jgi:hypothetical protein
MAGTWSYDPTELVGTAPANKLNQVRRLIGDTLTNDQQIYDEEITFAITQRASVYGAAADCCRYIAAQFSRKVDTVQGDLRTLYSTQAKAYSMRADELERSALAGATPYAGAMTNADKESQVEDCTRVSPQFNIGMDDNYLPVGAAGNVIPGSNKSNGGL